LGTSTRLTGEKKKNNTRKNGKAVAPTQKTQPYNDENRHVTPQQHDVDPNGLPKKFRSVPEKKKEKV